MKLKYLIILFFISPVHAQDITLDVSGGYNLYDMEILNDLQNQINNYLRNINIESEILDDFPSYFSYQLQLMYRKDDIINFGLFYDFASTGGRIHYKDYSGEYKLDQVLVRKGFGLSYEYAAARIEPFTLGINLQLHLYTTLLKSSNILIINSVKAETNTDYITDLTFGIQPGFNISYIWNFWSIKVKTSYFIDTGSTFYDDGNDKVKLMSMNRAVKSEWDSFKFELSLGLYLNKVFQ